MALFRTGLYVKNHSVEKVQVAKTPIASYNGNVTGLYIPELIAYITAKQSGSGTPSPDNIRPIIGVSECNVCDMSDITNIDYFQGLLAGTYGFVDGGTLSWSYGNGGFMASLPNSTASTVMADRLKVICPRYTTPTTIPSSYTNVPDKSIFKIYNQANVYIKDNNYLSSSSFKDSMRGVYIIYELETATTPTITTEQFNSLLTAFEISGWCVNIQLGDTYYGGVLDVTTGVLTVTNAIVDLGSLTWVYANGAFAATGLTGLVDYAFKTNTPMICSNYDYLGTNSTGTAWFADKPNNTCGSFFVSGNPNRAIYVKDTAYTDATTFKSAMNGVKLVYELATPVNIQLTPTQVEQLLVNNVFADTGDVEVKFFNVVR